MKEGTFKLLDVVAIRQEHRGRYDGDTKSDEVDWRVGLVLHVDNSTGLNHIRGLYVEPDGNLGEDLFDLWSGGDNVQMVDHAEVTHRVEVPKKWRASLVSAKPRLPPKQPEDWGMPETHPGYGIARLARSSNTGARLFMSPFEHHGFISIEICRASRTRILADDHVHGEDSIVSVNMSETQWARFVSSVGIGEGVPCTIESVGNKMMPECPPERAQEKTKADLQEDANRASKEVTEARRALEEMLKKTSVTKADVRAAHEKCAQAERAIQGSMPFVVKRFAEATEKIVDSAKLEVDTYVANQARRLGLAQASVSPIALPATTKTPDEE